MPPMRKGRPFHVGLDLDNTIINYNAVFGPVGVELGLVPPALLGATKIEIREYFLRRPGGVNEFMRLQGQVYGRYMERAALFDGVGSFIEALKRHGARLSIISHRTRYGHFDEARIDLHVAASAWLEAHGIVGPAGALPAGAVFFETQREGKLQRIAAERCDIFVDDLPDILSNPAFPKETKPFWFAPDENEAVKSGFEPYRSWCELSQAVLSYIEREWLGVWEPA